jgi:hypothetical protein
MGRIDEEAVEHSTEAANVDKGRVGEIDLAVRFRIARTVE